MLRPYMKLAKLSLNRARLSCMSWKCIMLASRSDMASDSSAKAGSKALRGNNGPPPVLALADSRKEERDEGRSGVVGREALVRDVERFLSCDMVLVFVVVVGYWRGCVAFLRALVRTDLAGFDALLSRLTTDLLKAVLARLEGQLSTTTGPIWGSWHVLPVLEGSLSQGPGLPQLPNSSGRPSCYLPALDHRDLATR